MLGFNWAIIIQSEENSSGKEARNLAGQAGGTVAKEVIVGVGLIRWILAVMALVALLVGAGGGAGLSFLLSKAFTTWQFWMHALPGAGWAILVAMTALWASMDNQRRFLYFPPSKR